MGNSTKWLKQKKSLGRILLIIGLIIALVGILLPKAITDLPFNNRIIIGIGILIAGLSIAPLVQYMTLKSDREAARKFVAEERDERTQMLRARAGSRAYVCSAVLAAGGLMWVSFNFNGSLPQLSADALWYYLAALIILPLIVYRVSIALDQNKY